LSCHAAPNQFPNPSQNLLHHKHQIAKTHIRRRAMETKRLGKRPSIILYPNMRVRSFLTVSSVMRFKASDRVLIAVFLSNAFCFSLSMFPEEKIGSNKLMLCLNLLSVTLSVSVLLWEYLVRKPQAIKVPRQLTSARASGQPRGRRSLQSGMHNRNRLVQWFSSRS
jgi:hypothetical protein